MIVDLGQLRAELERHANRVIRAMVARSLAESEEVSGDLWSRMDQVPITVRIVGSALTRTKQEVTFSLCMPRLPGAYTIKPTATENER